MSTGAPAGPERPGVDPWRAEAENDAIGTVLDRLARAQRVVPVLAIGDAEILPPLVDALRAGGVACIEVLLRAPDAIEHIRWIATHYPELCVGAGSVLSAAQWDAAETAGARFMVSPGATPALYARAADSPLPWLPGVQTPSEIAVALDAGYRILRFVPAEPAGGVRTLAAIAPMFPHARFCPTGGIDAGNCEDYLALPAVCWVAGSWLAPPALVATGRWQAITDRVRAACSAPAYPADATARVPRQPE